MISFMLWKIPKAFIEDKDWIKIFGEILYMQYPDENPNYPRDKKNSYGYLMQFADGIRIDLTVQSVNYALRRIKEDKPLQNIAG